MNQSNAMLMDNECSVESITMMSGASILFDVGFDPELVMSGKLEPETCWDWCV